MVGWSGETSSKVSIEEATALIGTLLLPWFEIWLRLPFDVPSESVEEVDSRRIGLFPREILLGYAETTVLIGTSLLPWFEIWLRLPFDVPSESVEEVDFRRIGLFPREISLGYAENDPLCEIWEGLASDAEDPPANHPLAATGNSLLSGEAGMLLREDVEERAFVMTGDSHGRPAPSEETIGEGERDNSVVNEELSGEIAGCGAGSNDVYVVALKGIDGESMGELLPASWPAGEGDAERDTERLDPDLGISFMLVISGWDASYSSSDELRPRAGLSYSSVTAADELLREISNSCPDVSLNAADGS